MVRSASWGKTETEACELRSCASISAPAALLLPLSRKGNEHRGKASKLSPGIIGLPLHHGQTTAALPARPARVTRYRPDSRRLPRPARQGLTADICQAVDTSFEALEPAVDIGEQYLACIWYGRPQIAHTRRSGRKDGRATSSAC